MSELEVFKKQLDLSKLGTSMNKMEQVDCPLQHDFYGGIYARTMFMPRDTIILGKKHRFETCNILLKGEVSVYMGEDQPVKRIKAPCIFGSNPGVQKILYSHRDVLFTCLHPTEDTDLEIIEQQFIVPEQIEVQE